MKILGVFFLGLLVISCAGKEKMAKSPSEDLSKKTAETLPAQTAKLSVVGEKLKTTTCSLGKDVRDLSIVKTPGGRCEVLYSKTGSAEKQADGNPESGFCNNVFDKIRDNLLSAGFSCR